MTTLNLEQLTELLYAMQDVHGYLTDNSCSDPDCCGGPFYTEADYDAAAAIMLKYGLSYDAFASGGEE